ncbi:hypothetical protein H7F15_11515 [Pontibacter sp. Tf4]|uniref:hypothetical protein n=1 Tax=Pontibacter sp. Tf4 TaxID=2761620 RepID=UPI001623DFAD|nr:hypothetical protein [Pontibacter sp. Tf4]MBB6611668.1 hypothetical protein [Pontibacter sp. Tf4]
MKNNLLYTIAAAALLLASCSSEKPAQTQAAETTTAPAPAMAEAHTAHQTTMASPAELMTEDGLPKDLVCMVNNAFMGKKQYPVAFEDKMYYGCCEMCVKTIQNQREVRYATDPVTGEEVDKSAAYIALKPGGANGDVLYFASEANYKQYQQL